MDRHLDENPKVGVLIPTGEHFLLLIYSSLRSKNKVDNIDNFVYYGKTRVQHTHQRILIENF